MDYTQIIITIIPVVGSILIALIDKTRTPNPSTGSKTKSLISTIAVLSSGIAIAAAIWMFFQVQQINSRFQFLPSSEYKALWNHQKKGAVHTETVSNFVPSSAKAVILSVIVRNVDQSTTGGVFLCADKDGEFNNEVSHFSNISITEYGNRWSGGMIICPISENGTFKWKLSDNESYPNVSENVQSYGALVGWF